MKDLPDFMNYNGQEVVVITTEDTLVTIGLNDGSIIAVDVSKLS